MTTAHNILNELTEETTPRGMVFALTTLLETAGIRGRWPEHKPPLPPHGVLSVILASAGALRDVVSGFLGAIQPDIKGDPTWEAFGRSINEFDDAMEQASSWLSEQHPEAP